MSTNNCTSCGVKLHPFYKGFCKTCAAEHFKGTSTCNRCGKDKPNQSFYRFGKVLKSCAECRGKVKSQASYTDRSIEHMAIKSSEY